MRHFFAGAIVAATLPAAALCQSSAFKPAFEIADVHASPRDTWVKKSTNRMRPGLSMPTAMRSGAPPCSISSAPHGPSMPTRYPTARLGLITTALT